MTVQLEIGLFQKADDEVLDYDLDWALILQPDGDSIDNSAWTVPAGLTEPFASSINGSVTKVWIEGGTSGEVYKVVNVIETTLGRIFDRAIVIEVL